MEAKATLTIGKTQFAGTATILLESKPVPPIIPRPPNTIEVEPKANLNDVAKQMPEGATIILHGTHQRQTITDAKKGQRFVGGQDSVMSGAIRLTGVKKDGKYLFVERTLTGRLHPGLENFRAGYERARYPEDLFIAERQLRHVGTMNLQPGQWHYDENRKRVYWLESDTKGQPVELSVTPHAFLSTAAGVELRDLAIARYATPNQFGAVQNRLGMVDLGAEGWVVENCFFHQIHGTALLLSNKARASYNAFVGIGNVAIGGGAGKNDLYEHNDIVYCGHSGLRWGWQAGGVKLARAQGVTLRKNSAMDIYGAAYWFDSRNENCIIEDNRAFAIYGPGAFYEISFGGVIRGNHFVRCGLRAIDESSSGWRALGPAIVLSASGPMEVTENTIEECPGGILAMQQKRGDLDTFNIKKLHIHRNNIDVTQGGFAVGVVSDIDAAEREKIWTSWGIRINSNTYTKRHDQQQARLWAWENNYRDRQAWQGFGQDANGVFIVKSATKAVTADKVMVTEGLPDIEMLLQEERSRKDDLWTQEREGTP